MNRLNLLLVIVFSATVIGCGPSYPNCGDDDDCRENEYCVNDQCQQCREDRHCTRGESCVEGRCDPITNFCDGAGDCGPNQRCNQNRCEAVEQTASMPAPPPQQNTCILEPVYFGYDADNISRSSRDAIQTNANCIRSRSVRAVHLTGHTDSRGTEEYNLALGDRRARAVQQFLRSLGVTAPVTVSSMGEELAQGFDEGSYQRDRRVVFIER